uniref:Uncharacterized protein n=1 Tax=Steinernema glaseri TaxID=37863 RepID=A0A1I8A825_9BILA
MTPGRASYRRPSSSAFGAVITTRDSIGHEEKRVKMSSATDGSGLIIPKLDSGRGAAATALGGPPFELPTLYPRIHHRPNTIAANKQTFQRE